MVKTEGVVLGGIRFRETSKIVTLYTRDRGKLRLVAKGALRPKSRLVGHLEPITHVMFWIRP